MPVVCLASASGSPGVTTTAVGLATLWPRPVVLVEADPTGGNAVLAGFFGGLLVPPGGVLDLVMAQRQNRLAGAVQDLLVGIPGTEAKFLSGTVSRAQAASLPALWPPLLECLRDLERSGTDVLVDAGRLGLEGWPAPLVFGADVTALLVGSGLTALAAARSWAAYLVEKLSGTPTGLCAVVVGPARPYSAAEVSRTLGMNVLETVPWDPAGAAVFGSGEEKPRHFDRSGYVRRLVALGEELRASVGASQHRPGMEWIMSLIQRRIADEQH
jgi:hypothetical protein